MESIFLVNLLLLFPFLTTSEYARGSVVKTILDLYGQPCVMEVYRKHSYYPPMSHYLTSLDKTKLTLAEKRRRWKSLSFAVSEEGPSCTLKGTPSGYPGEGLECLKGTCQCPTSGGFSPMESTWNNDTGTCESGNRAWCMRWEGFDLAYLSICAGGGRCARSMETDKCGPEPHPKNPFWGICLGGKVTKEHQLQQHTSAYQEERLTNETLAYQKHENDTLAYQKHENETQTNQTHESETQGYPLHKPYPLEHQMHPYSKVAEDNPKCPSSMSPILLIGPAAHLISIVPFLVTFY